jgi:hypothetical protein
MRAHRVARLKIALASGIDLVPSLEVGIIGNTPSKARENFSIKEVPERGLLLEGGPRDREYAFAMKRRMPAWRNRERHSTQSDVSEASPCKTHQHR